MDSCFPSFLISTNLKSVLREARPDLRCSVRVDGWRWRCWWLLWLSFSLSSSSTPSELSLRVYPASGIDNRLALSVVISSSPPVILALNTQYSLYSLLMVGGYLDCFDWYSLGFGETGGKEKETEEEKWELFWFFVKHRKVEFLFFYWKCLKELG